MVDNDSSGDLIEAVRRHTALFNECVRGGDWAPFVATFTADARMTVIDAPIGTLVGRAAIAALYASRPPVETMRTLGVDRVEHDTVRVRLAWESGAESTMVVRWRGDAVCGVELTLR
jgi:hypothetical protein